MFDLITDNDNDNIISHEYNLYGTYIDDESNLQVYDFNIFCKMDTNIDEKSIWDEIVSQYKNKLLNIRGYSNFYLMSDNELILKDLNDNTKLKISGNKKCINHKSTFAPFTGFKECFKLSLQHEASNLCHASNGGYSNVNVDVHESRAYFGENTSKLNFIIFNGVEFIVKRGKITHEFYEDRNPTCATCLEGYNEYTKILHKLGSIPILDIENIEKVKEEYSVTYDGMFIKDMNLESEDSITETIYQNFYPIIEMAKIKKVKFEFLLD